MSVGMHWVRNLLHGPSFDRDPCIQVSNCFASGIKLSSR
jgi:hypothetical protein